MNQEINNLFKNIPLRISITDHCNLKCFFCSNEGMDRKQKNTENANFKRLSYLLDVLKRNGLNQIAITGGDPTCYPKLNELLDKINSMTLEKTFFHTNGVSISKEIIKNQLKSFSKVAVSIHTINFESWSKLTGGTRAQFDNLMKNLKILSESGYSDKIEIKIVPIKGFNDSEKSIKEILDFCSDNKFKFKFLNFEPVEENHKKLVIETNKIEKLLNAIGATPKTQYASFRGQKGYLPIKRYQYKNAEGVLIEIGCGKEDVCKSCADSNEVFITPELKIKPCHVSAQTIELKKVIDEKDEKEIINCILNSRCFLKTCPGQNAEYWRQTK